MENKKMGGKCPNVEYCAMENLGGKIQFLI
jgi:hypothetical protein